MLCKVLLGKIIILINIHKNHNVDGNDNVKRSLPHTSSDWTRMMYSNELIAGCCYVKIRLFLIYKERVWHPNTFHEIRSYW